MLLKTTMEIYIYIFQYNFHKLKLRGYGSGQPPPNWKYPINDDFIYVKITNILNIIVGFNR